MEPVRIGDQIECFETGWGESLSGEVLKVGRTSLKLRVRVRWHPLADWTEQIHTVAISSVRILIRDFRVMFDVRPEREKRYRPLDLNKLDEERKAWLASTPTPSPGT